MPTIFQQDNFSLGIHTRPGQVENGESYAADIKNLRIDEQGWLTLRENFREVGRSNPSSITGVATSDTHLFVLRADRSLEIRSIENPSVTLTVISDVPLAEGRLSLVSTFTDYVMFTTEGEDRGYWLDFRDDIPRKINKLGIDPPSSDSFQIDSLIPANTDTTAFVLYAITYVRNFEPETGEPPPNDLFNGMESQLSSPVVFHTVREGEAPITGTPETIVVNIDGEWTWANLGVSFAGSPGEAGGGVRLVAINFTDKNDEDATAKLGRLRDALFVTNVDREFRIIAEDGSTVVTSSDISDAAVVPGEGLLIEFSSDLSALPSIGDTISFAIVTNSQDPSFTLDSDDYYPAQMTFSHSPDAQATGINVYRSLFFREGQEGYAALKEMVDDPDTELDLVALQFRKIAFVSRSEVLPFFDGVKRELSDPDDSSSDYVYSPYFSHDTTAEPFRDYYVWGDMAEYRNSARLPPESKSIAYHNDRLFAPVGDRLVFSDVEFGEIRPWSFPLSNDIRRIRPGRVDFAVSFREVLLFGGRDGLFRLNGADPTNFDSDEISRIGPLDSFAWSATDNTLGFVGENGLYLTDAATVEYVSDMVLDTFFRDKRARRGVVLFFSDNTFLFSVGLQPVNGGEIDDHLFRRDKGYWTRWDKQSLIQAASGGADWTRYWIAGDGEPRIKELEWNELNDDADLEWSWESNWISGRIGGIQNYSKQFQQFLISAESDTEMMLETWTNKNPTPVVTMFTSRDDDYFQIIPIERYAELLRFRVSGVGPLQIRGMQIET